MQGAKVVETGGLQLMTVTVTVDWIDVGDRLPRDGECVLGAIVGRYGEEVPREHQGDEFWFVFPMHFRHVHPDEETGEVVIDCFLDADGVVRRPWSRTWSDVSSDERITHWAELPVLPGTSVRQLDGAAVRPALDPA